MYYRGANAALLLYDITSLVSFEDVKGWLEGTFFQPSFYLAITSKSFLFHKFYALPRMLVR